MQTQPPKPNDNGIEVTVIVPEVIEIKGVDDYQQLPRVESVNTGDLQSQPLPENQLMASCT